MQHAHPVRAVLLDVDGTLVDSNDAHALAWCEALGDFGHAVTFERVREAIGKGSDHVLAELAGLSEESPRAKEIVEARKRAFAKLMPRLRPFDGAHELVRALRARGLALVIATSAGADELEVLLQIARVDELVPARTTSDDAPRSKPDPDIVLAAIAKSGRAPRECVLLGDTPYDAEAARRSGIRMIGLRCGGWDDAALASAVEIYDGPRDLLQQLDSSVLSTGIARERDALRR